MSNKPERIQLINRGSGTKSHRMFFQLIQKYILDGYRIADNQCRADLSRLSKVVMYLEGKDPYKASTWGEIKVGTGVHLIENAKAPVVVSKPVEEVVAEEVVEEVVAEEVVEETPVVGGKEATLEKIEATTKKADLLDLAKELSLTVPQNIKQPAAIQKFLRENV